MHKATLCLPPIWVQEITHEGSISASSSYICGAWSRLEAFTVEGDLGVLLGLGALY